MWRKLKHTQREREREIPLRQKKVRVEGQIGRPLLWLWVQMDLGFALRGNLCDEVWECRGIVNLKMSGVTGVWWVVETDRRGDGDWFGGFVKLWPTVPWTLFSLVAGNFNFCLSLFFPVRGENMSFGIFFFKFKLENSKFGYKNFIWLINYIWF